MNIYDIAGNVFEWTLEKASGTDLPCADRGGGFTSAGSSNPADNRNGASTDDSNNNVGFRVSLFQEKLNARNEKFETRGKIKMITESYKKAHALHSEWNRLCGNLMIRLALQ